MACNSFTRTWTKLLYIPHNDAEQFLWEQGSNPYWQTDLNSAHDTAERRCHITNIAMLSNDRLVAIDTTNSKVKLFYAHSGKHLDELDVYDPRDVAATIKDQVAVTSCFARRIFILKVSDTTTNDREISVSGACSGIAYSDNRLVISVMQKNGNCRLEIFDLDGHRIKRIRHTTSTDGMPLFKYPDHLCISRDSEEIIVGDICRNELISLTFKGQLIRSFFSPNPKQMCTDSIGNVYVSGGYSEYGEFSLARLTTDGRLDAKFLTAPYGLDFFNHSVAYCHYSNRLFVCDYHDSVVLIYQLA